MDDDRINMAKAYALPPMEDLIPFAGKWVATMEGQLIASGESMNEVLEKAYAKGIYHPYVFRVPRRPRKRA